MWTTLGTAIAAFFATNVDDIVILAALFGMALRDGRPSDRQVVIGQYLGFAVLWALSALGAFGLLLLPDIFVRLLGIVPLAFGLHGLWLAFRRDDDDRPTLLPSRGGTLGVAGITFANGGDNVAIYVPYFASVGADGMALVAIVFTVLVGIWCVAGRALGTHPRTVRTLDRYGDVLVPVIFIALGVLILLGA